MNGHRKISRQIAREKIRGLEIGIGLASDKERFIATVVDPLIIDYEKKYGIDRFLKRHTARFKEYRTAERYEDLEESHSSYFQEQIIPV